MSKLVCRCGHVIRDQLDALPYKAALVAAPDADRYFDWIAGETQAYVEAAVAGTVDAWLARRGYDAPYRAQALTHGAILHDHLHGYHARLQRDVYRCAACGRLHVQSGASDVFRSYVPEDAADPGGSAVRQCNEGE